MTGKWGRIQTCNPSVKYLFFLAGGTLKEEHKKNRKSASSSFTIAVAFLQIIILTRIFQDVSDRQCHRLRFEVHSS